MAIALEPFGTLNPRFDTERKLLVLDLDHGKANEMGSEQLAAFEALCDAIESSGEVRTLCTSSRRLSKRGKPIFIAGANVTERTDWDDTRVWAHVIRQRSLMVRLRKLPVFNIAITHGITLGWGAEYLLTVDYTLATDTARLGLPETGLGILPGARGTAELAAVIGPGHALRLGCTGEQIDGAEALRIGLVHELTESVDSGLERAAHLAELVLRRSPTAVAAYKHALIQGMGCQEEARLALEADAYELCVSSGEAAVGRAHFSAILKGETPPWGPRRS